MKPIQKLAISAGLALWAVSAYGQAFTGADVGTPALPGSVTGTPPGVQTITGGGSDIWGTTDNFYYYYATVSAQEWDAVVRVQDLQGPDTWTKCELMVRWPDSSGTPKGPDPFIAAMTTRTGGQNQVAPQWRTSRGGNADWNALGQTVRPSYPDTWLRVTRVGSLFTMYYGTDGTTWTKYVDIDTAKTDLVGSDNGTTFGTPWPNTVLVGVAVTAHNDSDLSGGVATVSDLKITITPTTPTLSVVTDVQDTSAYVGGNAFFLFQATNTAIPNGYVGDYQWYKNGSPVPNATASRYAFVAGPADEGAKIHCVASLGAASVNSSTGTVTVLPATEYIGYLKYEQFRGQSRGAINSGNYGIPDNVWANNSGDGPYDYADNYASRMSGYFVAPTTGKYVFFVAADDDTDLYLSTDENPSNARLIAQEMGWSQRRYWISSGDGNNANMKRSDNWTPDEGATYPWGEGISLMASQKYWIATVHHEGGGGDNVGIYYKLLDDPDPTDGTPSNLTGDNIIMLTKPANTLNITKQPTDYTTYEGLKAVFSVAASTDAELTPLYQWQRNGVDMAGRTAPNLSFDAALADDGAKYRCVITVPPTGLTVTSDEATLKVNTSVWLPGLVKQEIWGPNNNSVTRAQVEAGSAGDPTSMQFLTMFDTSDFAENYVQRLVTYFVPKTTGKYVFLVSSDDDSDLFVSTDEDPANKQLVAQQTGWNANRNWSGATGQRNSDEFVDPTTGATPGFGGISMTAGKRYYIEGVHHEGTGGDNFAAYVMVYGDLAPADGTESNLRGDLIQLKLPAATRLEITQQPQSVTTHGWDQAVFSIEIDTDALYPPTYQWRRNGVNIPTATGKVYSLITEPSDSGAVFDCVVTLAAFGSTTSSPATLTVLGDAVFTPAKLKQEYFSGAAFDDVINGNVGAPTSVALWDIFEGAVDIADNYTRRVTGMFIPPVDGKYVFFTSSDDQSNFYISTDDKPSNKRLVAQQTGWNSTRTWNTDPTGQAAVDQRRSDRWSPDGGTTVPYYEGIPLSQGVKYYIEGVHREGGGGDNFAVTFKLIDDVDPVDGDAPLLTGDVIGYMAAPAAPEKPTITVSSTGGNIRIEWTPAGGHLESSPALGPGATWTSEGTANPATLPISGGAKFFRVVVP